MRAQEFLQEVKARYEMTDLDPWTFDQTPAGWRGLPSSARQADALNQYIDRYVKDGQFVGAPEGVKTVRPYILYWHLGQVLTQMGRNGMASRVMRQALDHSDPSWNAYVMATVSFLRKDRKDFDHWAPLARGNEETIKRLTDGWGRPYKQAYAGQQGVAEGDKMSLINLDQSLANTPPVWKKFISSLPPQLAREFVDERPRPDQDDIDFLTPLRLVSPQPVSVRVADLLRHPENQGTIGRSPDDVVAAVNQRWGLKIPSGKKYDPNPARYRAYAQMAPGTASPSVMADGVILFGAGRFVAAALRGDETMRVWSMTRKQGVAEGSVTKKPQPYNEPDWAKKLPKEKLNALAGPRYKKDKKEQGVAEGQLDPYRLERLDPQTRRVLQRMADHAEPGSWLSASEAYAMMLGLQYKNRDPRGWEQEVQHYVDLYRQYSGQGISEVKILSKVKGKGSEPSQLPRFGRPIAPGEETRYLGTKVADWQGREIWRDYLGGQLSYHLFDPDTRTVIVTTFGSRYKMNPRSYIIHGLYAAPGNPVRAAEFYRALVRDLGLTLISDRKQSPGGNKVWQQLEQFPDVEVYGYDTNTDQALNFGAKDVEMYTVPSAAVAGSKEMQRVARDLRLVATAR